MKYGEKSSINTAFFPVRVHIKLGDDTYVVYYHTIVAALYAYKKAMKKNPEMGNDIWIEQYDQNVGFHVLELKDM